MRPHYSIVTQPAIEPVTYAELADHVRLDSTDDDVYATALISVAREYVESLTGRVSNPTTFSLVCDSWEVLAGVCPGVYGSIYTSPWTIPLARTPLVSVTSVKYYAPDVESQTTMSTDDYRVITSTEPGLLNIKETPPAVDHRPDAIEIEFLAGVSGSTSAIMKHAIKMMAANLYEQRAPVAVGTIASELPLSMQVLIDNQKLGGWF